MDLDTRLWREASLAADTEGFLDHAGAALLDELGLDSLAVRSVDADGHRLDTVAWIRRGRVGVSRPRRPRTELRDVGAARLRAWVTGGEPMTGAQASYLETLSEEAGEQFDADLTKAEASEKIDELQERTGRGQ